MTRQVEQRGAGRLVVRTTNRQEDESEVVAWSVEPNETLLGMSWRLGIDGELDVFEVRSESNGVAYYPMATFLPGMAYYVKWEPEP